MRAVLVVLFALVATACSKWAVKYPGELAPEPGDKPNRGFVVTQDAEAYELDVTSRDARELHAIVREHWAVGLQRNVEIAESPSDTVERLGWPTNAGGKQRGDAISIPIY